MGPRLAAILIIATFFAVDSGAQHHRILPVEHWSYEYIQRLQQRGHMLDLDPTRLPYHHGDVVTSLDRIDHRQLSERELSWIRMLEQAIRADRPSDGNLLYQAAVEVGATASTTERYDMLRPLDDAYPVVPDVAVELYTEADGFFGQVAARHNYQYVHDPDGLASARRLKARHEDMYIGYRSRIFDVVLGRYSNHWGLARQPGLIISDNPRSYDLLAMRIGGPRLSISSILGELDNITADDRYTGEAFGPGAKRRFISANRVDWRVNENFRLALLESILYSGEGSHVSLRYLNPLRRAFFSVANQPMNDDVKGLIAAHAWYHRANTTYYLQFLVDDIDIMGHGNEPPSLAFTTSVHAADLIGTMSAGGSVDLVTARTYNTHVAEGQYIYLLRGLATQFSDYIHLSAYTEFDGEGPLRGVTFRPRMHVLWQGEQDMRVVPFPATIDLAATILDGTPERTVRAALQMDLQRSPTWWIRADVGVNFISNHGHIEGESSTLFAGILRAGFRFDSSGILDLGF
jgi:hypothetical protein